MGAFFFYAKTVGLPLTIGLVSQLFAVIPPASLVHVHTRLCLDSSLFAVAYSISLWPLFHDCVTMDPLMRGDVML